MAIVTHSKALDRLDRLPQWAQAIIYACWRFKVSGFRKCPGIDFQHVEDRLNGKVR